MCGDIDKELVSQYYSQSNAVVLMSLSEGFGLSLIEGMHFGLPAMSFTDIDAYDDIYNESSMIGVKEHTDEKIAEGLMCLLNTKWNNVEIINCSRKFESSKMALDYVGIYKKTIQYS